jgi:RNA recognition motif-containing protein
LFPSLSYRSVPLLTTICYSGEISKYLSPPCRSDDARHAYKELHGVKMDGRRWEVDYATEKDFKFFGWKWFEGGNGSDDYYKDSYKEDKYKSASDKKKGSSRSRSRSPPPPPPEQANEGKRSGRSSQSPAPGDRD